VWDCANSSNISVRRTLINDPKFQASFIVSVLLLKLLAKFLQKDLSYSYITPKLFFRLYLFQPKTNEPIKEF